VPKHSMKVIEPSRLQSVRVLAGLGLALVLSDSSFGQGPIPAQRNIARPTVSPYLNIVNGSGNRGLNYFTQVRPQQQFRSFGAGVERQLQTLNSRADGTTLIDETGTQAARSTGHSTSFLNTAGYFSVGGGASAAGGGSSRARPSGGLSQAGPLTGAGQQATARRGR
jgi:hypothetical protein